MIYTELTKKALKIAFDVHKEQVDKAGVPYIFHPFHLAEEMDSEAGVCTALLHDVIEDGELTFDELVREGFGEEIISALRLLTHDSSIPYMDYIKEIKKNPLAKKVKLADLKHNSDLSRLSVIDEGVLERNKKYQAAILLLSD